MDLWDDPQQGTPSAPAYGDELAHRDLHMVQAGLAMKPLMGWQAPALYRELGFIRLGVFDAAHDGVL
jgi:hypothetical protein